MVNDAFGDQDPIRVVNDAFGVHEHSEESSNRLIDGFRQNDDVTPDMKKYRNAVDEFYEISNDGQ